MNWSKSGRHSYLYINTVYKTTPVIIHANGISKESQQWRRILNGSSHFVVKQDDVSIVTYSDNRDQLQTLDRQLSRLRIHFFTSELSGGNWSSKIAHKMLSLYSILPQIKTKFILSIDNNDALINGSLCVLKNFMEESNTDAFFGAEVTHWPKVIDTRDFEWSVAQGKKYKYLNAGVGIFRKSFLMQLWVSPPPIINDQAYWKLKYRELFPKMRIDNNAMYIQNILQAENDIGWV